MKNLLLILTLSVLCTLTGTASAAPVVKETEVGAEGVPSLALSEEVLFKFLSAELSAQRGEHFAAYATMLTLARGTNDSRLARRALEFALAGQLPGEALKAARVWRDLAPRSDEAAQALLGLQLANGRYDEAKQVLAQQLAAASPSNLGAVIGNVQKQAGRSADRAQGIALLRELLQPYRDAIEARLTLVQLAMLSGDRPGALREAREATTRHPKSELAALTLAQILENKQEAEKSLAEFLQKNPKAREVRQARARMLFEQGSFPEAKKEFQTLLQQTPDDPTSLYAVGLLSVQMNDLKDAELYLSSYIKTLGGKPDRERDSTQALMVLAQISEDRGDIPAALKWLELAVDAGPRANLAATVKSAQLQARSGQLDLARALLSQTDVESDDERVKLLVAEAQLLRDADRLGEALKLIADALENNKDNVDLLYEHGMLAEKAKQFDSMEISLRKIIKLTPENQHAYNALGYSLADRNVRLPEAYDLLTRANQLAPNDPYIMDSLGWVEFRLGRFEKAEEILRRAFDLKPDPEIAAHLGEVLWARGREEDAKKLWRNANARDPKNETLKGTLQRLQVKL